MQLEGAKAELRSRPDYEAADLGVLLLRALFWPAFWAWLGFVLPLQLAVLLACSPFATPFAYLSVWWLKPVYDRAFGLVVGRGLFGDAPRGRALYRALWSDGRRGLLGDLLWRRLDPARTFVAPVALLEGLSGKAAARRRRMLSEGSTTTLGLLLLSCAVIEIATGSGLFVGAKLLLPAEAHWIADDLWSADPDLLFKRALLAAYVLAIGVAEPLFVASGFGLYLNRRTNIEGWDVELTFRRMARRLAAQRTPAASADVGAALVLLLALSGLALCADHAKAQATTHSSTESVVSDALRLPRPEVVADAGARAAMARVLARPELQRSHVEEHWQLRNPSVEENESTSMSWLSWLADKIARGFVILLWALGALLLVVVIYLILQRLERRHSLGAGPETLPEFVAKVRGIDAKESLLPTSEVVPRARALLAEGRHVAALSVLYIGTLAALVRLDRLELPRQATEGQCLAVVRGAQLAEERRALFTELTALWQLSAYAHAQPEQTRLTEICDRFSACFGAAA